MKTMRFIRSRCSSDLVVPFDPAPDAYDPEEVEQITVTAIPDEKSVTEVMVQVNLTDIYPGNVTVRYAQLGAGKVVYGPVDTFT